MQVKRALSALMLCAAVAASVPSMAQQADLEINTPAITAIRQSMQARHNTLAPYYASGAIGLTKDGLIAMREASAVPLKDRQAVNAAIGEENSDRRSLYREIAKANNHPEWEDNVRSTFAGRWISKAQGGWYYQDGSGSWVKK